MLSLYKTPSRRSQDSESTIEIERVLPPGTPYLTKVNGKLVMAREKTESKAKKVAVDLLGEAFGVKTRVIHKRAKSLDKPACPLLIGGVPYVPQQQVTYPAPYTMPLPQQAFSQPNLIPYTPQPSFMLPNPSQQDFNQLQQMQAHYSSMYHPGPRIGANGKVEVNTTTITITKHICAGCGRIRSKKYHHDHPLKEGETPEPDFCRKCQKDSSSTDSEGSSKEKKKKRAKKTKQKKQQQQSKHSKHSSDEEDSDSPVPKVHTKPKHQAKKEARRIPSEEYIIVEEEISEEEAPRPRGRVRERVVETTEVDRYPQPRQSSKRSTSRPATQKKLKKPVQPAKIKETVVRETIRRRSPSVEYEYIETERKAPVHEERETYPKKIPVHFHGDVVQDQRAPSLINYRERERASSGKAYSVEEVETTSHAPATRTHYSEQSKHAGQEYIIEEVVDRPGPSKQYYEERDTLSVRADEARQRRGRERNAPSSTAPWEAPHVIHPTGNEEVIVVTERYEYRPKKQGNTEESRRRQEYIDRATMDRHQANQFEMEEAAKYYHEDWSRAEPDYGQREPLRRMEQERSYRRERHRDAELSDSEASYEYRTGQGAIPRAPSPPSAVYHTNNAENWHERPQPPYPLSSDSEPQRLNNPRKGNTYHQPTHNTSRSTSRPRPAYVRETTDGGTEYSPSKDLIPSPHHSRSRSRGREERYVPTYIELTPTELAERERAAESEVRRVNFQEPSMLSKNSWTETSETGPVHKETTGSGWGRESEVRHVSFQEPSTVSKNSWTETSETGPVHKESTGRGWGHSGEVENERHGWDR